MQTRPQIKDYVGLGMLRSAVCGVLCGLCLVQNAWAGPPPVITTQPQNQTVQTGGTATFVVTATSGTTLTYQWYFQSNSIPGATNNIYARTNAQVADAGAYYAKVSNADGTVNSTNAILTVNDAPALSGANDLPSIVQNDANNPGGLVSSLIANQVADPNPGALQGIAVVAVNNANGSWQYSINGGSTWSPFGSPTPSAARLLAADANTRVRFVPNTNFAGTVTNGITFRAWDQTSGSNGGTLAITIVSNTVLDQFSAVSYYNNDGTQLWSTRWMETEAGAVGPSSGYFKVNGIQEQLQLLANHTGDNIYREADLTGATSATLTYWYDSTSFGPNVSLQTQVSGDGGSSYTNLITYQRPGGSGTQSFDITPYISGNTQVRFYVSSSQNANNDFRVDDVQIAYQQPGGGATAFSASIASSSITVALGADVATTLTGPASVLAAATFTYTVTVNNQGPSTANNLTVSHVLPPSATFVSASGGGTFAAGVVTWSLANLSSGTATNCSVTVTAPSSGTLTSSVWSTASTGDPDTTNNDGSAPNAQLTTTVAALADIAATVTGPSIAITNTAFSYTITVTNHGPSAANNVTVSDALPPGATFVSASGGGTYAAGVVTWSLASLPSWTVTNLSVTVVAAAAGSLTNIVGAASLTDDPDMSNNNGSAITARAVTGVHPFMVLTGNPLASGGFQIEFYTNPNTTYSIQASNDLTDWETLTTANSGNGHVIFTEATVVTQGQRFYRSLQTP